MNVSESKNGFVSATVGPPFWLILHTISLNYPHEPTRAQKKDYYTFVKLVAKVFPCGACRTNLTKNLADLAFSMNDMESRTTFSIFVWKLHNTVNTMLGKNVFVSFTDFTEFYEKMRAGECKAGGHGGCSQPVPMCTSMLIGEHNDPTLCIQ